MAVAVAVPVENLDCNVQETGFTVTPRSLKRSNRYIEDCKTDASPNKLSQQENASPSMQQEKQQSSVTAPDMVKMAVAFLCIKKAKEENMSAFEWWRQQREILVHRRTDADCAAVSAILSREELQEKVGIMTARRLVQWKHIPRCGV